jgi:hypothetical protein
MVRRRKSRRNEGLNIFLKEVMVQQEQQSVAM